MPVPLPSVESVNLLPPDAAEAQIMADGVAAAVAGREGLLPIQRAMIEALFPAMTGHAVTVRDSVRTTPSELAAALARRDGAFRARAVQVMLLCALVRHPIPDDVAHNVADFAVELGVDEGMVDVAQDFAAGSLDLAVHDFQRNGYEGTWNEQESAAAVHSSRVLHDAWAFSEADPDLAAQWASLEDLPSDAIGRKLWELYQARGFTFPGLPGSAPPLLAQHDWVHVLADYGTTVEAEVEVFGFIARRTTTCTRSRSWPWSSRCSRPVIWLRVPACSRPPQGISRRARTWLTGSPTCCAVARSATTRPLEPRVSTSSKWTGSPWRTCRAVN